MYTYTQKKDTASSNFDAQKTSWSVADRHAANLNSNISVGILKNVKIFFYIYNHAKLN